MKSVLLSAIELFVNSNVMPLSKSYFGSLVGLCACFRLGTNAVQAQVTPDNTLSTRVTSTDSLNFTIENGERAGTNLFHSFEGFSIPVGGSIHFNNSTDIDIIFSRVTGGRPSDIDGLLSNNGTADLFLMNPAGIVFGENAFLNLGGSFFATTAESIVFDDGAEFSAIQANRSPLLTVNVFPGLQMGSQSGSIVVRGNGHALIGGATSPYIVDFTAPGLQVNNQQTLSLLGADITLTGGLLRGEGSNLSLVSNEDGLIYLEEQGQTWHIDTTHVQQFGDITLLEKSLLDTSGVTTGDISLYGNNISFNNGSLALSQNAGNQASGNILVNAEGSLDFSDTIRNAPDQTTTGGTITGVIISGLVTETIGAARSGDITVEGNNLRLLDGAGLDTKTFSDASAGAIDVNVDSIEIERFSAFNPSLTSTISSTTFMDGSSGAIGISTDHLTVSDGGVIASYIFGSGNGGEVQLNLTENLNITGFNSDLVSPSFIGNVVFGTGNSGNVIINAARISVLEGASVGTVNVSTGDAEQITVNASESVTISGAIPELSLVSGVLSNAPIQDETFRQTLGLPDQPSGSTGTIVLNTPDLQITDGGQVAVNHEGVGNAGRLRINAEQVLLDNLASITAFSASGQGGEINLDIQDVLVLNNNSTITAEAAGTLATAQSGVDGGNVEINSPVIVGAGNSDIVANAFDGNGGNIRLITQGLIGIEPREQLTPANDITVSSELGVDGMIAFESPNSRPDSGLVQLSSNLADASNQIMVSCVANGDNQFIRSGRGGLPESPFQMQSSDYLWPNIPPLDSGEWPTDGYAEDRYTENENAANVEEETAHNRNQHERLQESNGWTLNQTGEVELLAVGDVSAPLSDDCLQQMMGNRQS